MAGWLGIAWDPIVVNDSARTLPRKPVLISPCLRLRSRCLRCPPRGRAGAETLTGNGDQRPRHRADTFDEPAISLTRHKLTGLTCGLTRSCTEAANSPSGMEWRGGTHRTKREAFHGRRDRSADRHVLCRSQGGKPVGRCPRCRPAPSTAWWGQIPRQVRCPRWGIEMLGPLPSTSVHARSQAPGRRCQPACKPGSVGHGSEPPHVTAIPLGRPLPAASSNQPGRQPGDGLDPARLAGPGPVAPIRSCSRWGLPCRRRCRLRGALLPHPFTLTRIPLPEPKKGQAVCFLWRFPWGHPRRTLSGTVSPWSPDFPPHSRATAVRPTGPVGVAAAGWGSKLRGPRDPWRATIGDGPLRCVAVRHGASARIVRGSRRKPFSGMCCCASRRMT